MATNYKIGEVVEIIAKANDAEALTEVGRRFPIMTVKIASALAGDKQSIIDLFNAMPDYVTALKVSNGCKEMFGGDGEEDEEEEEEKKPKKAAPKKAAAKKAAPKKAAKKAEPEPEEDEEEDGKYDGKTPKELYAECKKRGLDVEPRKAAKVYIEALEADDAEEDEEEEEWDI